MSESQRPNPIATQFVVPDLELEPAPRPRGKGGAAPAAPTATRDYGAPTLFDADPFDSGSMRIEINQNPSHGQVDFGSSIDFDAPGGLELQRATPALTNESGQHSLVTRRSGASSASSDETSAWPSGRTPDAEALSIDPIEVAILADFGEAPSSAYLTPIYAYRVFARQRELKQRLSVLSVERERAEAERQATLAELACALRPAAERVDSLRRFFAPLVELEEIASQRGRALSSVNAELGAESAAIDGELTQIALQVSAERVLEQDAARWHAGQELLVRRGETRFKRVQIEIRAVTHVAERKLGPQGGRIPEPEAGQLAALRQRSQGIQPELAETRAGLDQAKLALAQARARLDALRRAERQRVRKKQALAERYQKELQARSASLSESVTQQRAALAEVARAVLAAHGSVPIDAPWLERVRLASERADLSLRRAETQRRALEAYDRAKVTRGVQLACSVLGLFVLLLVLKLAL